MSNSSQEKSPMETFGELKTMVSEYARQETVEPIKLLGKWLAFGLGGAICVAIGAGYLTFGLLRWTQSLDVFDGDTRDFWPYLIAFAGLLVAVGLAGWAMTRTFSDDDS